MIENPGQAARKNAVRDLILGVVFFYFTFCGTVWCSFWNPADRNPKA